MELEKSVLASTLLLELESLRKENTTLLEALLVNSGPQKVIPAKLSLKSEYVFSDVYMLDQGSQAGIKVGDLVTFKNFLMIGNVSETGPGWSKVTQFSALGESTVLRGGKEKDIVFEAKGAGAGILKSDLPVSVDLAVGEALWWGEGSEYLVALVEEIRRLEGSQLQEIIMRSPARLDLIVDALVLSI